MVVQPALSVLMVLVLLLLLMQLLMPSSIHS